MLKKVAIVFAIVVVLVIGALLVVPMFYSIDQFRPQIQAAAEKSLRGKVELGKLSLALFPSIRVNVDGVKVTAPAPFDKEPFATVENLSIRMPLLSLIAAPRGTVVVGKSNVVMITEGTKDNLTEVLPPVPTEAELKAAQTEAKTAPALEETLKSLPGFVGNIVKNARFAFELQESHVEMRTVGAPAGDKTHINKLTASLTGIGIETPMELKAAGELDVAAAGATLTGPFSAQGDLTYKPVGRDHHLTLKIDSDLKQLDVAFKPLFHKKPGVPFGAGIEGTVLAGIEKNTMDFSAVKFRFANVEVGGTLKMTTDAIDPTQGDVDAAFAAKEFQLAPWGSLIPMVADFKLDGAMDMSIKAKGALLDPALDVSLVLKNVSGATPDLHKPISNLNGALVVKGTGKNPNVTIDPMSMKIGDGDLTFKLNSQGLAPIVAKAELRSNFLNVDEVLGLPPPGTPPAPAAPTEGGKPGAPAAPAAPPEALDAALTAMAPTVEESLKNPLLDQLNLAFVMDFKKVIVTTAELTNATFNLNLAKRKLTIAKTGLSAFGGKITFNLNMDMAQPKAVGYSMSAGLAGVRSGDMIKIYAPAFKDDISGTLSGTFNLSGKGLRKEQLAKDLSGGMKGDFVNGKLKLPIQKMATESLKELFASYTKSGALAKLGPKVAGYKVPDGSKHGGEFKTCKLDLQIKGRELVIAALDVNFQADNNRPAPFNGSGKIDFDRNLDLVGISHFSDEDGTLAPLKGKSGMVEVPMRITGTMDNPKPDYGYTIAQMGKTAGKALGAQAAQSATAKAIDELAKKGPAPVQNLINKAGGADKVKEGAAKALKGLFGK